MLLILWSSSRHQLCSDLSTRWCCQSFTFFVFCLVKLKVKLRRVELLLKLHLRATGCRLPSTITQCYLPPDISKHTPILTPVRGWYLIYLSWTDERLSWPEWLVTYRDGLPGHRRLPIQVLTRQCRAESNAQSVDHKSDALTITLPSHHHSLWLYIHSNCDIFPHVLTLLWPNAPIWMRDELRVSSKV